jgi:demethylmenaquinone methyltransferase/2-methoxy-6-polyprenyl-1,4-benzoquinol methylase
MEENGKKIYVKKMFDSIAHRYDFLNHFLSFGVDYYWRRATSKKLNISENSIVLDLATGTGDLAIEINRRSGAKIIGVDIAHNMLVLFAQKLKDKKLDGKIKIVLGDAEKLPFYNEKFDAVTIAFGIRNVSDLPRTLKEMNRILNDSGKIAILEFSRPKIFLFKQIYFFYFKNILPLIGEIFSGHNSAYNYLPESVSNFFEPKDFVSMMNTAGFKNINYEQLTFGIVTLYMGEK